MAVPSGILRIILAAMLMATSIPVFSAGIDVARRVDSLLVILDREITLKPYYEAKKRAKINAIRDKLNFPISDSIRYEIMNSMFNEYRTYAMDTSLTIARECREIARRIGDDHVMWRSMLMEAEALKGIGYYDRSLRLLDSLPAEARHLYLEDVLSRYYSVYYSLAENTLPRADAMPFRDKLVLYRDSLVRFSKDIEGKTINEIEYYKMIGDYQSAIDKGIGFMWSNVIEDENLVIFQYIVAEAYLMAGNEDMAMLFFTQAAIGDIRMCVRKYNALPTIAELLNRNGDVERAYNYIMCSLEDIKNSCSQSRMHKVIDALPIITNAYMLHEKNSARTRNIFIVAISVLAFVVIVTLVVLYYENNKLNSERLLLRRKNEELLTMKENVDRLNRELEDSSKTKEEYIGQLFNLCSEYINIMAKEHSAIIKIVRKGKLDDIEKSISNLQTADQLKSFFDKFDKIFIDIFPDFIDRFNLLLQPQYRVNPPDGELTPELRIFALIRLGFTDTTKIARFLHYSPQTIYNYRFKVRNHALIDKDAFIKAVRDI